MFGVFVVDVVVVDDDIVVDDEEEEDDDDVIIIIVKEEWQTFDHSRLRYFSKPRDHHMSLLPACRGSLYLRRRHSLF